VEVVVLSDPVKTKCEESMDGTCVSVSLVLRQDLHGKFTLDLYFTVEN
jgi:hypothetical protein